MVHSFFIKAQSFFVKQCTELEYYFKYENFILLLYILNNNRYLYNNAIACDFYFCQFYCDKNKIHEMGVLMQYIQYIIYIILFICKVTT